MVFVEISSKSTGEIVKRMGPFDERKADRVASGASINMNHEDYRVTVVPAEQK